MPGRSRRLDRAWRTDRSSGGWRACSEQSPAMRLKLPRFETSGATARSFIDARVAGGSFAAVDVRGGAPGTRETGVFTPGNLVSEIHGLLFTGGSAFGLAAADGVVAWLARGGVGFEIGPARVPIVAAAVLFDLAIGDPGA